MTNDLQKVKDLLKTRGCSERTINNYLSCLNRFKQYHKGKELKDLKEEDILDYLKVNFIDLDFAAATINVNRAAIKYYYLVKVQVLSSLFKGKLLSMLKSIDLKLPEHLKHLKNHKELNDFLRPLYNKDWVTYIEPPKGSPENVIEYIGRYSFRVAISNDRKSIDNGLITFEYKDYKDKSQIKEMTISAEEFIRRFLLHVLPSHFTKIKHYGLLSNRNKKSLIKLCRILIGQTVFSDFTTTITRKLFKFSCPKCGCNSFNYSFHYKFERSCYC